MCKKYIGIVLSVLSYISNWMVCDGHTELLHIFANSALRSFKTKKLPYSSIMYVHVNIPCVFQDPDVDTSCSLEGSSSVKVTATTASPTKMSRSRSAPKRANSSFDADDTAFDQVDGKTTMRVCRD